MAWVNILSGSFPNTGAYTYNHVGTGVTPVGLYFETDGYPGTIDSDVEMIVGDPFQITDYVELDLPIGTAVRVTYVGGVGGSSEPTELLIGYMYDDTPSSEQYAELQYDDTQTVSSGINPIEETTLTATTKVYFGYSSEGVDPASMRATIEVEIEFDEFWTDELNASEIV